MPPAPIMPLGKRHSYFRLLFFGFLPPNFAARNGFLPVGGNESDFVEAGLFCFALVVFAGAFFAAFLP